MKGGQGPTEVVFKKISDNKLGVLYESCDKFLKKLQEERGTVDIISCISFADISEITFQNQKVKDDMWKEMIAKTNLGGSTNYNTAMLNLKKLTDSNLDGIEHRDHYIHVFFMTDGQCYDDSKYEKGDTILSKIEKFFKSHTFTFHTIGFGTDCNEGFLKGLSSKTQGIFVKPGDSIDLNLAYLKLLAKLK